MSTPPVDSIVKLPIYRQPLSINLQYHLPAGQLKVQIQFVNRFLPLHPFQLSWVFGVHLLALNRKIPC